MTKKKQKGKGESRMNRESVNEIGVSSHLYVQIKRKQKIIWWTIWEITKARPHFQSIKSTEHTADLRTPSILVDSISTSFSLSLSLWSSPQFTFCILYFAFCHARSPRARRRANLA